VLQIFGMAPFRDRGIFIPQSRSLKMVNMKFERYRAISMPGGRTTKVTQAAGPACDGDREVLDQASRVATARILIKSLWSE
jgi:hypothetical protein